MFVRVVRRGSRKLDFSIFRLSFDLMFLLLKGVILRFILPFILYGLRELFFKLKDFIRETIIDYRVPTAPIDIVHPDSFITDGQRENVEKKRGIINFLK